MIIDRYLAKEILLTLVGVAVVLLLIFLSARLVGTLAEAASGALPVNQILVLLALRNISNLEMVLPLSLYLGTILALSRMYMDNEMTALSACGVGGGRLLRTVLIFSVFVGAFTAFVSIYASPWAESQIERILERAASAADVAAASPGNFRELRGGSGVFYVQELSADKHQLQNVFVQVESGADSSVVSAASGRQYTDPKTGVRYLELENGYRYEGQPGRDNYTVVEFARHGLQLRDRPPGPATLKQKATPTLQLWRSGVLDNLAEVQWRVSMGLWVIVLGVIAVPLSYTSPRQGRYARMFSAMLIFLIYSNFLNVARSWLEKGQVPPALGLWWVHGVMLLVAVVLWQIRGGSGLALRRHRR